MANRELDPGVFSAGVLALGKLLAAIQAPDGAVVTAENIAAQIDPALAPEIMTAQVVLLLFADVLEILGTQEGVAQPYWLGAPRAIK
jgi:hypothetical protein